MMASINAPICSMASLTESCLADAGDGAARAVWMAFAYFGLAIYVEVASVSGSMLPASPSGLTEMMSCKSGR